MVTLIFFVQWFPTTMFPCVTVAYIVFFHCCILMLCLLMSNKRSKCSFHHCWSLSLWVYFWSGIVEEEWNRLMPTSSHSREQGPQEGVKPLWVLWKSSCKMAYILIMWIKSTYVERIVSLKPSDALSHCGCTDNMILWVKKNNKKICKPKINQDYLKMWSLFCIGMWKQIQQNSVFLFL